MEAVQAQATEHPHIVRHEGILGGEPIVRGTRTPVRAIVELHRQGLVAEEIAERLPHLRLAQVYDALAFAGDHAEEIERHIKANRVLESPSPAKA